MDNGEIKSLFALYTKLVIFENTLRWYAKDCDPECRTIRSADCEYCDNTKSAARDALKQVEEL